MKRSKSLLVLAILLASTGFLTSCGGGAEGVNGDMLDVTVSGNGIILPLGSQSCTDIQTTVNTGKVTTSLAANSLQIYNFSITWKPNDFDLNLPSVTITVISNRIAGGQAVLSLLSTEVEKLLGARYYTLSRSYWGGAGRASPPTPGATPVGVFSSHDSFAVKGLDSANGTMYPCSLAAGGITLADPKNTSSFTATVRIDLLGVAYANANNVDPSAEKVVRKSVTTTATFY